MKKITTLFLVALFSLSLNAGGLMNDSTDYTKIVLHQNDFDSNSVLPPISRAPGSQKYIYQNGNTLLTGSTFLGWELSIESNLGDKVISAIVENEEIEVPEELQGDYVLRLTSNHTIYKGKVSFD